MKCAACGFDEKEQEADADVQPWQREEFVAISGEFTVKSGEYDEQQQDVTVYACPKCSTLKLGDYL